MNNCPKCQSENIYQDSLLWVCPECGHEWTENDSSPESPALAEDSTIRDANGVEILNGDSVIVLKDLKVKGSSSVVKGGTKVRNVRLSDQGDGHNLACKIDGIGSLHLKSEFVRKA